MFDKAVLGFFFACCLLLLMYTLYVGPLEDIKRNRTEILESRINVDEIESCTCHCMPSTLL